MSLAATEVNGFLKGIENHARAHNFDQVLIQTNILLEKLESAIHERADDSFEYRKALPSVRALIPDSARADASSVLDHVRQAQTALGFAPE
jgi:hypothetical protein